MPIFGSDGALVGTVERLSGVRIVVRRTGASDADQHFIPLARVTGVTDRVTLDCPAADARPQSAPGGVGDQRRVIGPLAWGGVGIAAIALLYGVGTLLLRAKPRAVAAPAPAVSLSANAKGRAVAVAPPSVRPAVPPIPLARPATIAAFLESDSPVPQRFSLDGVAFVPGSAGLDGAAAKAVDGIAGVMSTHLNTMIKLAVSSDGGTLAQRRAAAIRAALILRGVAPYRIATGPARIRFGRSASGVEMVVLAK